MTARGGSASNVSDANERRTLATASRGGGGSSPLRRRVPSPPQDRIVRKVLAGDVAQCLKRPPARVDIERPVIRVVEQSRQRLPALIRAEHPGLRQAARGTLPNHGGRIVAEHI